MKPVCTSRPDLMLTIPICFLSGWGIGWDTTHKSGCWDILFQCSPLFIKPTLKGERNHDKPYSAQTVLRKSLLHCSGSAEYPERRPQIRLQSPETEWIPLDPGRCRLQDSEKEFWWMARIRKQRISKRLILLHAIPVIWSGLFWIVKLLCLQYTIPDSIHEGVIQSWLSKSYLTKYLIRMICNETIILIIHKI